jgi:hypothetical protein
MGWGQTGRILLVWPERGRVLTRRIDLVLLQRHCTAMGAQLALVTSDPDVCFHADQLAIPVFKKLRTAQNAHWRVKRRRTQRSLKQLIEEMPRPDLEALRQQAHPMSPTWINLPAARMAFFTIGVLALLSIAAVLLPSAEVNLYSQSQIQSISLNVEARPGIITTNITGIIPAHQTKVVVEGRDTLEAQGIMSVPDQPATGEVTFTNLTNEPVHIPKGSIVRSDGQETIRFATTADGDVEAGTGISLTLPVQAVTPGLASNLPPSRLTAIEGPLGLSLTATNKEPTQGGTDRNVRIPTNYNRTHLYEILQDSLRATAENELKNQIEPGDILLSVVPTPTLVLEEVYEPAENQPAEQLTLSLRLEFEGMIASNADLQNLATAALDANLPEQYAPLPGTLEISNLNPPQKVNSSFHWRLQAKRQLQAHIIESQTIQLALGLPIQEAEKRLQNNLPLEESPHIQLSPAWWPRLPILPFRIHVAVGNQP